MQPVFTPYNTCSDTMLHFGAMTLSSSFIQCMKQQWILPSKNCSPIDLNLLQIHFETVYGTCKIYSVNKIRKLFDFAISLKANSNRIYIPTYVSHATCQPKYKKKRITFNAKPNGFQYQIFLLKFCEKHKLQIPKLKSSFFFSCTTRIYLHSQNTHALAHSKDTMNRFTMYNVFISLNAFPSVLFGTANDSVHKQFLSCGTIY